MPIDGNSTDSKSCLNDVSKKTVAKKPALLAEKVSFSITICFR